MTELSDSENFLDAPNASKHSIAWFRERLLVFVPDVEGDKGTGYDPDQPNIVRAMSTVVGIAEAPFLESYQRIYTPMLNYVCVGSGIAGNNHRARILEAIRLYGQQHRQVFKPRVQDVVRSDMTLKGTFMGSALFVPEANELPRGFIELCLSHVDAGSGDKQVYRGKAVFSGSDRLEAGFYAFQDRAVLGFGNGMPTFFAFEDTNLLNLFHLDTTIALLPASVENPRPRLMVARMDRQTSALLNQDKDRVVKTAEPHSIYTSAAGPDDQMRDLNFDDQTGEAIAPLQQSLQSGAAGFKASLKIVPNNMVSRLRHEPPRNVDNFFSIMGIVLPSPVGDNDSDQVCLNFRTDGHFIGHSLDALSNSTLVRTSSDLRSRILRIMDEAVLADVSGVTDVVRLWDGKEPDPVGAFHQLVLISERKRLSLAPQNPMHIQGSVGFLASFGRKKQYYTPSPSESEFEGLTLGR